MKTNSFEEEIRRKLEAAEMKPRPQVWERIEGRLPKQGSSKRPMLWGLLCLLLCAGLLGLWQAQQPQNRTTAAKNPAAMAVQPRLPQQATTQQPVKSPEAVVAAEHVLVPDNAKAVTPTKVATPPPTIERISALPAPPVTPPAPIQIADPAEVLSSTLALQSSDKETVAQLAQNTSPSSNTPPPQTHNEPIRPSDLRTLPQTAISPIAPLNPTLSLSDLDVHQPGKRIDKKRWAVAVVAGSSALAYNSGLQQNDGRPLNPLRLNTTGIMEFKVVDSLNNQVVSVRNVGDFKDIAASGDVKEVKIVESAYSRFIGFDLQYRLNKRFSLESGLRLHRQNVSIYHVRYVPSQTFYSLYMNRSDEDRIGGVNYAVHVMEFPLMLNTYARLGSSRSEGFLSLGATYRRWLFEERTTQFSTAYRSLINTNASLLNFNRYNQQTTLFYAAHNLGLRARLGYQYHFSDKLRLYAALHSQYLLRKMYRDTYYTGRNPLMVGVEVGMGF